ncbi:ATP-binding domain-containing protein [Chondromyces crocatus]|uniref:DNA helicase n=1 Tax=Chondromyces crocatus TaxID=52 RepID=A0A0K1E822_CHOCO|nr:ATP-binding domain-containing protein [Chondromyces crocatus]AKT36832.1 DNA helicase [Chondromyces crocatus]
MQEPKSRPLTAEESVIVAEQERLAGAVREAMKAARGRASDDPLARAARITLRDDYATAGEEDRPALLAQLHEVAAREDRRREEPLTEHDAPYFAHMRVRVGTRSRDVLLGARPLLDTTAGVSLIDYRRAPLAEVFFTCLPGDDYEIDVDGRTVEGVLERRHLVSFERNVLTAVSVPGGTLRRGNAGWRFEPGTLIPTLSRAAGQALAAELPTRVEGGPRLASLLDDTQRALLRRDPREPLLVLGAAGCGKTTVALHRVAAIVREQPDRFDPASLLVIVPEEGLLHLARRMLADLGMEQVAVRTFDGWIRGEARRLFPRLPGESEEAPFGVRRVKRHPALTLAIDAFLDATAREIGARLDRLLVGRGAIDAAITRRTEPILDDRLRLAEQELVPETPPTRRRLLEQAFREERKKLTRVRGDLRKLVGDRALLDHAARVAPDDLPPLVLSQVTDHTRRQLDESSEVRYAHVDADRRATLDGRSLDEGTPDALAGTVDVEDYALLLELLYRKTGRTETRAGELSRYTHLVLDEAQEFAPIELRVLGRALAGGSATVAGDAAQRIDQTSHFASWDAVVGALGIDATPTHLETSYRCPRPIVEVSHAVLGEDAPKTLPRVTREGPPVLLTRVPSEGHAAVALTEALRDLVHREPRAAIAVIAHDATTARAAHEVLARVLSARLVLDGDFAFAPGIEVTEIGQVKGLEFDVVVVPDADAASYPDTNTHRRMLHVALTRASHQAWLIAPGAPSPILARLRSVVPESRLDCTSW